MQELKDFFKSRQRANMGMILFNFGVFAILCVLGDPEDAVFMAEHGASYTPYIIEGGEYYRLFTCMFLHFGIEHLFYNMLLLLFVGDTLEKTVGKIRYLVIYLAGGMAGNVVSLWFDLMTGDAAVSAGASGAIFAVVGALIWIVLRNKGRLEGYSIRQLVWMAVLSIAGGLTSEGIDNCAHIGGLAAGFLLAVLLYWPNRRKTKACHEG